jgi:hypothetical protein
MRIVIVVGAAADRADPHVQAGAGREAPTLIECVYIVVSVISHRGFGLELIERSVAHELGGQAVLDYRVDGLVCEITVPLTDGVDTSLGGAHRSA